MMKHFGYSTLRYLIILISLLIIRPVLSSASLLPAPVGHGTQHGSITLTPITVGRETTPLNPFGCTFRDMVRFYLSELGIESVPVYFIKHTLPDPHLLGYTQPKGINGYLVVIAHGLEPSELRVTVAHELVHVRQMEQGTIDPREFGKDYLDRRFEDEAFRLSLPLAAAFYQSHDCR